MSLPDPSETVCCAVEIVVENIAIFDKTIDVGKH
jgi:hypothetical protein